MDYKKIIRSRKTREAILRLLRFIPDEPMLKLQYRIKTGRRLDLKDPQRFTEKLQWYKLHYHNPVMHICADKFAVREYVKSKGLGDTLIPLIAHYGSVDEVDWDRLPDSFVIKTTNGGGGLNVIVCPDKVKLDLREVREKLRPKRKLPHTGGREWAYYGLEPGIVVEELLVNREKPEAGVNDYKFFCYGGKAKYVVVDVDRFVGHKRNFYDVRWNDLHVTSDCPACDREIPRPENLEHMIRTAEILSEGFPFVRVDLYNADGRTFFGEMTFYPWSGYVQYTPDEADLLFGRDFRLAEDRE